MVKKHEANSAQAIIAIKDLLSAVEKRSVAVTNTCPRLIEDEDEEVARLREVAEAQREVDHAVDALRMATKDRLAEYSNAEVIVIAHLWAGIWSSANTLRVDSDEIDRFAGRNNPEEMNTLIRALLDGSSSVLLVASMVWSSRASNCYTISITNPNKLHRLILGDIQIA